MTEVAVESDTNSKPVKALPDYIGRMVDEAVELKGRLDRLNSWLEDSPKLKKSSTLEQMDTIHTKMIGVQVMSSCGSVIEVKSEKSEQDQEAYTDLTLLKDQRNDMQRYYEKLRERIGRETMRHFLEVAA